MNGLSRRLNRAEERGSEVVNSQKRMENTGELEGGRDNQEIKFIIGVLDRVEMDRINIQKEDNENFSQSDENYQATDSRNFTDPQVV